MFNIIVKYIVGGAIKIGHLIDGMCIKSYIYQVIVIINLETETDLNMLMMMMRMMMV